MSSTATKVDRLALKTMPVGSPKAQITGGKALCLGQRVEDNAFHLSEYVYSGVPTWDASQ